MLASAVSKLTVMFAFKEYKVNLISYVQYSHGKR